MAHGNLSRVLAGTTQFGHVAVRLTRVVGTMGLKGDLSTGEILEQLAHASAVARIRNIVFMVRALWEDRQDDRG